MKKSKTTLLIVAAAVIFLVGIIGSLFVLFAPKQSVVNIIQDGKTLMTLRLSEEKDRTFVLPYGDSSNTIEIKDGRIRVKDAQCPDKTCVHTGWLSSSAMPIVCLPNHLVISFADSEGEVDAVAE